MKGTHYFIFLFLIPFLAHSQAGEWTWMQGDSLVNSMGSFGIQGVPSPTNEPPGLYAAGFWTDTGGNLWVYGGVPPDYVESANMWMFNPVTTEWTWMQGDSTNSLANFAGASGVFDTANSPGGQGYGIPTWTDQKNHLWMYAGSDLWEYDPSINQWAWINGSQGTPVAPVYGTKGIGNSANTPGYRSEANATWVDSAGNLWLFGGMAGVTDYNRNDMWEYNISQKVWIWWSGSSNYGNPGSYGPIGVASVNYYPSARACNFHWQDSQGFFWLVGGGNLYTNKYYNDVWKFNPANQEWTLMKGSAAPETANISSGGTCQPNASNEEGGRFENRAMWKINDNVVVNYAGYYGTWPINQHNDLWAYLPQQSEWMEINQYTPTGYYGTEGIPSSQNHPPVRIGSCSFKDKQNNLWMFGGMDQNEEVYNDVWKYIIDTSCIGTSNFCNLSPPVITPNTAVICPNDSADICAPAGFNTYVWSSNDTTPCIQPKDTGSYYVTVTDNYGCTAQSNAIALIVRPAPHATITASLDTFCANDSSQICATIGFVSYVWNNNPATGTCIEAKDSGSYYVVVTDTNGCSATSNPVTITLRQPPNALITASTKTICPSDSAQICAATGFSSYSWNNSATGNCIQAKNAGNYYVTVSDNNGCTAESNHIGITVLQPPPVSVSRSGDTLIVYDAIHVQWYLNNNLITGATHDTYIANSFGNYTVAVTDTNGCTSYSLPIVYTGIENINGSENISIYPNPLSAGNWQLAVNNNFVGAQVEILDDNGRIVYKSEIKNTHSEIAAQLSGGIYLLRIISGNTIIARKLVKL